MSALNEATMRQHQAADPAGSTWLSANAGSGKTRVLTDRVARLLLQGVPPQNILCLTYTKAAASEMQNRLFKRLGEWAMLPEDVLREALSDLGVDHIADLPRARTLFARAIEAPGGLKIQTIHAFCSAVLRRFPLEAGVSPQFVEIDERAQKVLIGDVLEAMADDPQASPLVDALALHYTGEDIARLATEVARHRAEFEDPLSRDEVWKRFGLEPGLTGQDLLDRVLEPPSRGVISDLMPILRTGSSNDQKAATKLAGFDPDAPDIGDLVAFESVFLTGSGAKAPFTAKVGAFPTKDSRLKVADPTALDALMERVADARPVRLALLGAEKTAALHGFAAGFLPRYGREKLRRGWLDFDDLILKTRRLLSEPSVADWVLFRLDGGTDHILVDEAQDTNPVQWQVIELLAREFAAGHGARADTHRTLFVVGDRKQSIYSFQGADPDAFDRMFDHFEDRLGAGVQRLELRHSFRSSRAILQVVDATFSGDAGAGLGQGTLHEAFHAAMPGRVDLWPIIDNPEKQPDKDWFDPVDLPGKQDAKSQLAGAIAQEVKRLIDAGVTLTDQEGKMRRISAGDILILLQRRSQMFHQIIRCCKAEGLAVAGVDRLKLNDELAVRDITALLSFLVTPEDNLSLATALRSPLFGWSEDALYNLAQGRDGAFLWQAMRDRDQTSEARQTLDLLRRDADFLRPYELIERILTRHHGRARLLGRLGVEAEDGIDELLNQALAYERLEVPSLTGFLAWLYSGDVEVKRELAGKGRAIRVMTVHGAKGLEAPVVILPDTLRDQRAGADELLVPPGEAPLWKQLRDERPPILARAADAQTAADAAERRRLLYVAMTRAENWLIVCGAGQRPAGSASWYDLVETGMTAVAPAELGTPAGAGQRFETGLWADPIAEMGDKPASDPAGLPTWIGEPAPRPDSTLPTLSPSDLGGAKALARELSGEADEAASLRRGRLIHLALEHLPELARTAWESDGAAILRQSPDRPDADEIAECLAHAIASLDSPAMADALLPGALAEVGVTAALEELGGRRIHGTIDRLIVSDDRVLAIDYKSNRIIPANPDAVPDGLLRQMGAYAAALAQIYPDRRIDTAILWTGGPALMPLPHDIVRMALRRTTLP